MFHVKKNVLNFNPLPTRIFPFYPRSHFYSPVVNIFEYYKSVQKAYVTSETKNNFWLKFEITRFKKFCVKVEQITTKFFRLTVKLVTVLLFFISLYFKILPKVANIWAFLWKISKKSSEVNKKIFCRAHLWGKFFFDSLGDSVNKLT